MARETPLGPEDLWERFTAEPSAHHRARDEAAAATRVPQPKVTPGGVTSTAPSSPRHSQPESCVTRSAFLLLLLPHPRALGDSSILRGHRSRHGDTGAPMASGQGWPRRAPLSLGSLSALGGSRTPRAAPLHQQGCSRKGGGSGRWHCARW